MVYYPSSLALPEFLGVEVFDNENSTGSL